MKTVKEVAIIFSIGEETVRRWIKSGKLKATKINKRVFRVSEEEIERLKKGE